VLRGGCYLYWEEGLAGLVPLPAVYTTAVSVLVTGFVHLFGAAAAGKMPLENREFRFNRAVLCCDPHEFALGYIPTTHLALRVNSPTHTLQALAGWRRCSSGCTVSILNLEDSTWKTAGGRTRYSR
jgi:hypothetical protein